MIYLVTGGARSGKSAFAEGLYGDKMDVVYIATSMVLDREMENRVRLHRKARPDEWRTFEGNYNLHEAIGEEKNYLLDCITALTSNIMYDMSQYKDYIDIELQRAIEDRVIFELENLIEHIKAKDYNLVLVTNELGDSIVPEDHISRVFRDAQGRINQKIASIADEAYLVCCGMPVKLK